MAEEHFNRGAEQVRRVLGIAATDAAYVAQLRSHLVEDGRVQDASQMDDDAVLATAWHTYGPTALEALTTEPLRRALMVGLPPAPPREASELGPPLEPIPSPRVRPGKDLLDIVLEDEDGQAIPHATCRITFPDGSTAEFNLDADGQLVRRDVDPGTCKVTFPDFDEEVWDKAEAQ